MATSYISIPLNPLTSSANFLSDRFKLLGEAAKDSPRIPNIVKDHLDKPGQIASKFMPVISKCDSALEGVIPIMNNKLEAVTETIDPYVQVSRESYADGGIKQATKDVCTKFSESPFAQDVKTAYADGGVKSVFHNILERVQANAEDCDSNEGSDSDSELIQPNKLFRINSQSSTEEEDNGKYHVAICETAEAPQTDEDINAGLYADWHSLAPWDNNKVN